MAKTLFMAVLTLCVSATYAEQFEDLKGAPNASQWTEAAAAIGMNALIVAAGKEKSPEAGKVMFTVKGNSGLANSSFPIVPSKTKPGQLERTVSGKTDTIVMADSDLNRSLFRNLLLEVLKVANSKDEKKAKAAAVVASELLKVHYGKSLSEIAPSKSTFSGASGLLGKGKGLHLGGELDLGGEKGDGHAALPEAAPEARLLDYMQNPKAWVQATDCGDGGQCTVIPGQVMNTKLGGNLAIDDKLAAAINNAPAKAPATATANASNGSSSPADGWLLDKLKAAKKSGQKRFLMKFGADGRCPPCRQLSSVLKRVDPTGKAILSGDIDSDPSALQAFQKYMQKDSIPLTVVFELSEISDNSSTVPAPVWTEHGVAAESTIRSQLGK
jgi:hypothetical protein